MIFKNFLIANLLTLFTSLNNDHTKLITSQIQPSPDSNAVYISVKLKQKQLLEIPYTDIFFEGNSLKFFNGGTHDTVIIKPLATKKTISITYTVYDRDQSKGSTFKQFGFLANPGDTIHLSLEGKVFLNVTEVPKQNLIADGNSPFYIDGGFLPKGVGKISKEEAWLYFKNDIDDKYKSQVASINSVMGNPDAATEAKLTAIAKCHYFKKMFDWLWEANGGIFLPAKTFLIDHSAEIQALVNNPDMVLGQEVLNVVDGYVRLSLLKRGEDWVNGVNVFNEALKLDLGEFKNSYLTVCVIKNPLKKGAGYLQNLNDYRAQMVSDTMQLNHVNKILKQGFEQKKMPVTVKLMNTQKGFLTLDAIVGKKQYTVIDFWASWCVPCRAQMPYLDKIKKQMSKASVQFISINLDNTVEKWLTASKAEKDYLVDNNFYLPSQHKASFVNSLNITAIPRYVILKKDEIIASDFYQPTESSFKTELEKLMATK